MSGTPCLIIIRGNRAQANTRYALSQPLPKDTFLLAEQLIGGFQSLCSLGTTTYDGVEVMSDEEQESAASIMGAYNDAIEPLLLSSGNGKPIDDLIEAAHAKVYALLAAVADG